MSYWTEVDPPMSFIPEGWSYEQKRAFRYDCIPYLPGFMKAERYKGRHILCVGDGSGIDAVEFARAGAYVRVIDMSQKSVVLTIDHAKEAGVHDRLIAIVEDATDICEIPGIEDAVYSFGVIHHIPEVQKAVSEIARVLKPGGEFFGMVYHKDGLLYSHSILARGAREGLSPALAMQTYSERNPGCPHSVAYTRGELGALLSPFFSTISTEVHYNVIDLPTKRKVHFSVNDPAANDLGWHLCFRAVK